MNTMSLHKNTKKYTASLLPAKKDLGVFEKQLSNIPGRISVQSMEEKITASIQQLGKYFSLSDKDRSIKQFRPESLETIDPTLLERLKFYSVDQEDEQQRVRALVALDRVFGRVLFLDIFERKKEATTYDESILVEALAEYEQKLKWYQEETRYLISSLLHTPSLPAFTPKASDEKLMEVLDFMGQISQADVERIQYLLAKPMEYAALLEQGAFYAYTPSVLVTPSHADVAKRLAHFQYLDHKHLLQEQSDEEKIAQLEMEKSVQQEEIETLKSSLQKKVEELREMSVSLKKEKNLLSKEMNRSEDLKKLWEETLEGEVYTRIQYALDDETKRDLREFLLLYLVEKRKEVLIGQALSNKKTLKKMEKLAHELVHGDREEDEDITKSFIDSKSKSKIELFVHERILPNGGEEQE